MATSQAGSHEGGIALAHVSHREPLPLALAELLTVRSFVRVCWPRSHASRHRDDEATQPVMSELSTGIRADVDPDRHGAADVLCSAGT